MNNTVLEELARRLLEGKAAPTSSNFNHLAKVEANMLKIFGHTLFGLPNFHKWLYSTLVRLARPLEGCTNKDELMDKIVTLITSQKQGKLAHVQLQELSKDVRDESKTAPKPNGVPPKSDPLSALQDASDESALALKVKSEIATNIKGALSKVLSADELTLSFRSLEKEIAQQLELSRKEIAVLQSKRASLSSEKDGRLSEQKQMLERLREQDRQYTKERLRLQEKRRELERELEKVDHELKTLETATSKNLLQMQTIQNTDHSHLQSKETELAFRIAALSKDENAAKEVTKFIEDVRTRVLETSNKEHNQLEGIFRTHSRSFVSQIRSYAEAHSQLAGFLKERIAFCTQKLNAAKAEHKKLLALGLHDSLKSTDTAQEDQWSSMIEQDSQTLTRIASIVSRTFASTAKQVTELGLHTDPASGYAELLQSLLAKRAENPSAFPFDITPFPEPRTTAAASAPAAAVASGDLFASSASNKAVGVPSRSVNAPSVPTAFSFSASPSIRLSSTDPQSHPNPPPGLSLPSKPAAAPSASAASPSSSAASDTAPSAGGKRKPPMKGSSAKPRAGPSMQGTTAVLLDYSAMSSLPPPPSDSASSPASAAPAESKSSSRPQSSAASPARRGWAAVNHNATGASDSSALADSFPALSASTNHAASACANESEKHSSAELSSAASAQPSAPVQKKSSPPPGFSPSETVQHN